MATEVHSLTTDEAMIDMTLFQQVTDRLKVDPSVQGTNFPSLTVTTEFVEQYEALTTQMVSLRSHLVRTALTATHPRFWPRTVTEGSQGEGIYCLRMALPTTGKCNLWSLKSARARRTADHWDEITASAALFPGINVPHWTYTMTEFQLYQNDATVVTLGELPTLAMNGLPVNTDQHMAALMIALPRSRAYTVLSTGQIDHTYFTNCQVNGWYCARSALLRLAQMYFDEGIQVTDAELVEPLTLVSWNPEMRRLSGLTVHGATDDGAAEGELEQLHCFNRLWIDHCLSTVALQTPLQLSQAEMNTGIGLNLRFTLQELAEVRQELTAYRPFGLHSRRLPRSVLRKLETEEMTVDETEVQHATAGPMEQDGTATVTIGQVPLNHTLTVRVQMN